MLSLPKRARDEGKALVSFFECVVGSSRDQFGWRGGGDRMVNFLALGNTENGFYGFYGFYGSLGCGSRRRRAQHRPCVNDNNVFVVVNKNPRISPMSAWTAPPQPSDP